MSEMADVLRRAEAALDAKDYALLKMLVESHAYLAELLADKEMSLARLRKILFGASTEKTAAVTGRESEPASSQPPGEGESPAETLQEEAAPNADSEPKPKPKRPGHGRNGADAYPGAEQIVVSHSTLHAGDNCPNCTVGTVYRMATPKVLIRFTGHAPVQAAVYRLERLRCNLCNTIFTAEAPEGVGTAKYDATVGSMIALLKYGSGLPFNREEACRGCWASPCRPRRSGTLSANRFRPSSQSTPRWCIWPVRASCCTTTTRRRRFCR